MSIENILTALDTEIKRLQQARAVLASVGTTSLHARAATKTANKRKKRKPLGAEARKRIADAQRKRWAKQRAAK